MNIPKNVGITNNVPNKYQGVLLPHLVFVLSLNKPTTGVVSPSAIYPDSMTDAEVTGSNFTTSFTKYNTYVNQAAAHRSLLKWPTA